MPKMTPKTKPKLARRHNNRTRKQPKKSGGAALSAAPSDMTTAAADEQTPDIFVTVLRDVNKNENVGEIENGLKNLLEDNEDIDSKKAYHIKKANSKSSSFSGFSKKKTTDTIGVVLNLSYIKRVHPDSDIVNNIYEFLGE